MSRAGAVLAVFAWAVGGIALGQGQFLNLAAPELPPVEKVNAPGPPPAGTFNLSAPDLPPLEPAGGPQPALGTAVAPLPASSQPADPSKAAAAPADAAKEAATLETLAKTVETLGKNLTVVTGDEQIKIVLGGAVIGDFMFNSRRPVAPGTPFFLTAGPLPGFHQQTFDASGRQTTLTALVTGPEVCGLQSSAVIAACFYSSSLIEDLWGFLPIQAYAQLKNDDWRFAAGLQFDIFNPLNPTVLPISYLGASGNTGAFRTQARVERYLYPSDDSQITLTAGLTDPIPTTVSNAFRVSEDNGWPNVECRAALALGPVTGEGPEARRPFEVGVSGVVGQIRTTIPFTRQVVADVWGLGTDCRWAVTPRFGVQGEMFVGQALGTYMGGILQNINVNTFAGVHTAGGWIEVYYYICPEKLHTHVGYGLDDPLDRDLAPGQPVRNDTWFANLIWEVTRYCRVAGEFTYRKTAYTVVPSNQGFGLQTQVQFKF
jgi:hypothetical protein